MCIDSDYVSKLDGQHHATAFPPPAIEWPSIVYRKSLLYGGLLPAETIDHSNEIEAVKKIGFDHKKSKESFRIFGCAFRRKKEN